MRSLALCGLVTLAGCASVPLSTMWKMRSFSVEQFFEKDPTQLRVAIEVDRTTRRGTASPQVEIDIKPTSGKPLCYAFALDPIDASATSELPLATPPATKRWYVFALSPAGLDAFRKSRREGAGALQEKKGEFSLNVTMVNVLMPPDDAVTFPLRIDIALDRKDGYITLIKETAIKIDKTPKVDKPKSATTSVDACVPAKA